jgi:DNA-binding transcriptional LysR family regulator
MTAEQTGEVRGRLTIGAPTSFGILHLQQAIPLYLHQYPEVQISLSLADRFIDVVDEGFDLVIRIAALEDSSLIARRLAPCRRLLCASPSYLDERGTPQTPQDLALHNCLVYSNELTPDSWRLQGPAGVETVRVNGPLCADNGDLLRSAAVAGLGITLLPSFIVGEDLRAGRLREVLADYCPPQISIYAVYPSRRYLSAKLRSFIDFIAGYFGENPDWDRY